MGQVRGEGEEVVREVQGSVEPVRRGCTIRGGAARPLRRLSGRGGRSQAWHRRRLERSVPRWTTDTRSPMIIALPCSDLSGRWAELRVMRSPGATCRARAVSHTWGGCDACLRRRPVVSCGVPA